MDQELQRAIEYFERGELAPSEAGALLAWLLNNNHPLTNKYLPHTQAYQQAGVLLYDISAKCWRAASPLTKPPAKNKGGRPKSTKDLVAVTFYIERNKLEALDNIVELSPFSRSSYINFIIQRYISKK
jgi:hypothetical protein